MRIIGGHDYYDGGMAWGRDDSIVFKRGGDRRMSHEEVLERLRLPRVVCNGLVIGSKEGNGRNHPVGGVPHREFDDVVQGRVRHEFKRAMVILAGTVHRGLHAHAAPTGGFVRTVDERWIWTATALRSYALDHGLEVIEGRTGTGRARRNRRRDEGGGLGEVDVATRDVEGWFTPEGLTDRSLEAIVDERITIASWNPAEFAMRDADGIQRPWLIDQASLGAMEFARRVDPYSAFQEISMWRGGVLGADATQTVEIVDDLVKVAKHGFDRHSFRRQSSQG